MWQDLQDLQKDIDDLKQQAQLLGSRMQDAGVQLRSGLINPNQEILSSLEHYLKSYQQIKSLLGMESQYDTHGKLVPESIISLEQALARKQVHRETRDIIDNILSLCHEQLSNFGPLDDLKSRAEELKVQLNTGKMTPVEAQTKVRDYKLLLRLATEADQLGDQEWTDIMDEVVRLFGRPLATAAARGHLGMLVA